MEEVGFKEEGYSFSICPVLDRQADHHRECIGPILYGARRLVREIVRTSWVR